MGTAELQGKLWGARAKDWADNAEVLAIPLFERVLEKTILDSNKTLLDIGCGAGTFCKMASKLGVSVKGLDASENLISIAKERMPESDFRVGEMEELPYPNNSFDVVTGINSFQFAGNIINALKEAKRVSKKDGQVVAVVWGKPEDCDAATSVFTAISPFMPPPPPPSGRPPLFSEGAVESLAREAGLKPGNLEMIEVLWDFIDEQSAMHAILSAGLCALAIQNGGEQKVKDAVQNSLQQFKKPNGRFQLKNTFHCVISGV